MQGAASRCGQRRHEKYRGSLISRMGMHFGSVWIKQDHLNLSMSLLDPPRHASRAEGGVSGIVATP